MLNNILSYRGMKTTFSSYAEISQGCESLLLPSNILIPSFSPGQTVLSAWFVRVLVQIWKSQKYLKNVCVGMDSSGKVLQFSRIQAFHKAECAEHATNTLRFLCHVSPWHPIRIFASSSLALVIGKVLRG